MLLYGVYKRDNIFCVLCAPTGPIRPRPALAFRKFQTELPQPWNAHPLTICQEYSFYICQVGHNSWCRQRICASRTIMDDDFDFLLALAEEACEDELIDAPVAEKQFEQLSDAQPGPAGDPVEAPNSNEDSPSVGRAAKRQRLDDVADNPNLPAETSAAQPVPAARPGSSAVPHFGSGAAAGPTAQRSGGLATTAQRRSSIPSSSAAAAAPSGAAPQPRMPAPSSQAAALAPRASAPTASATVAAPQPRMPAPSASVPAVAPRASAAPAARTAAGSSGGGMLISTGRTAAARPAGTAPQAQVTSWILLYSHLRHGVCPVCSTPAYHEERCVESPSTG